MTNPLIIKEIARLNTRESGEMIKNIKLTDGTKTLTAIFGSGDVKVYNGLCGDGKTPMFAIWNGEKVEIGSVTNEGIEEDTKGKPRLERDHVRFIFEKEESLDVVIKHLQECKEMFAVEDEKRINVMVGKYNKFRGS